MKNIEKMITADGLTALDAVSVYTKTDTQSVLTLGMPCAVHYLRTGNLDCYKEFPHDKENCSDCICDSQKWLDEEADEDETDHNE